MTSTQKGGGLGSLTERGTGQGQKILKFWGHCIWMIHRWKQFVVVHRPCCGHNITLRERTKKHRLNERTDGITAVESGYCDTLWNLNFSRTVAGITKWFWVTIEGYLSYVIGSDCPRFFYGTKNRRILWIFGLRKPGFLDPKNRFFVIPVVLRAFFSL